jgi:ADP-ribosylglycohydrolase
LDRGFAFYKSYLADAENLEYYDRLRNLDSFGGLPENSIRSTGYVVDTLEAAVWSLVSTDSFEDALLKAVNLGYDTDTVGAVCGGLAGLHYGYNAIPENWLAVLQRRAWIDGLCEIRVEGGP